MLIVLTGKTASGKDTIASRLLSKYSYLKRVVTTTSRSLRSGEKEGIDYFFLTKEDFENKIKQNEFAEYVEYGGNFYGTYKKELEKTLSSDLIWKIDPFRAGETREFIKRAFSKNLAEQLIKRLVVIYITCEDQVILERLKKRGLSDQEIGQIMKDDKKIWQKYQKAYDFVIENIPGQLKTTVNKIIKILENHPTW